MGMSWATSKLVGSLYQVIFELYLECGFGPHGVQSWLGLIKMLGSFSFKDLFFLGKLTYVLKEEDTNIIRGIPQIYNDNRNIKQQMTTG
jgi:hypothetical protein